MTNGAGVSSEQVDRLIGRVDDLIGRVDLFVHRVENADYIPRAEHRGAAALLELKIAELEKDVEQIRANLAKVVWLVLGGIVTFVVGVLTIIVMSGYQP